MATRIARLRACVLGAWALVAVSLLPWLADDQSGPVALIVLGVVAGALAAPLPGLIRLRRYTYRWAALALAPALLVSMTEFVASPATRAYTVATAIFVFLGLAAVVAMLRSLPPSAGPPA